MRANQRNALRDILLICISTIVISALLFIPVYNVYGTSFFHYYEHFSIPSFAKKIYKGTIGVWGLIGFVAISAGFAMSVWTVIKKHKSGTLYK